MPWPKGVSRKGYVNKDGTPHKKVGMPRSSVGVGSKPTVPRKKKVLADVPNVQPEGKVAVKADPAVDPVLHGMVGNSAITEPCPNCMYAYADGGWCSACGWTKPFVTHPYDTYRGRKP